MKKFKVTESYCGYYKAGATFIIEAENADEAKKIVEEGRLDDATPIDDWQDLECNDSNIDDVEEVEGE